MTCSGESLVSSGRGGLFVMSCVVTGEAFVQRRNTLLKDFLSKDWP